MIHFSVLLVFVHLFSKSMKNYWKFSRPQNINLLPKLPLMSNIKENYSVKRDEKHIIEKLIHY